MPVYIIKAPNGQDVEMTSDKPPTDAQKAAIFREAGLEMAAPPKADAPEGQGDSGALAMRAAAGAAPTMTRVLEEVATNPSLVRGSKAGGEIVGGVTGLIKGGPMGAAVGMAGGEKAGGVLAAAAQRVASPVATLLAKAAPYAQALSTASGAQGALDLAQMAEPNRKDIGTFGVTVGDPKDPNHPALLNLIATKIGDAVKFLMDKGMSQGEAVRTVLNLKAKGAK